MQCSGLASCVPAVGAAHGRPQEGDGVREAVSMIKGCFSLVLHIHARGTVLEPRQTSAYDFSHFGSPPSASSFFFCGRAECSDRHGSQPMHIVIRPLDCCGVIPGERAQPALTASARAHVWTVLSGLYR